MDALLIHKNTEKVSVSVSMKDGLPIVYVAATVNGKDIIMFRPGKIGVDNNWLGSAQELLDLMAGR